MTIKEKINSLLGLKDNWDSYGSKQIDPGNVSSLFEAVDKIFDDKTPEPSIVPTNSGNIQLEWHCGGYDLEFEVNGQDFDVLFCQDEDVLWDATHSTDFDRLKECINKITRATILKKLVEDSEDLKTND